MSSQDKENEKMGTSETKRWTGFDIIGRKGHFFFCLFYVGEGKEPEYSQKWKLIIMLTKLEQNTWYWLVQAKLWCVEICVIPNNMMTQIQ